MRSIETIITDSKRAKQTDHPKITFTLDLDKQGKENIENKNKKVIIGTSQDTKQNSKTQTPERKTYIKNIQYKYNIR